MMNSDLVFIDHFTEVLSFEDKNKLKSKNNNNRLFLHFKNIFIWNVPIYSSHPVSLSLSLFLYFHYTTNPQSTSCINRKKKRMYAQLDRSFCFSLIYHIVKGDTHIYIHDCPVQIEAFSFFLYSFRKAVIYRRKKINHRFSIITRNR